MDLQAKYESLKRVKDEYLVGSQQAYLYNEALADYEHLQRLLDVRPLPTVREIGALCTTAQFLVGAHLDLRATHLSCVADWSLVSGHSVLPWTRGGTREYRRYAADDELFEPFVWYHWELDYARFLERYFQYPPELGHQRLALALALNLRESPTSAFSVS